MRTAYAALLFALTIAACASPPPASFEEGELIFGCAPSEKIVVSKTGFAQCVTAGYDDPETARAADGL